MNEKNWIDINGAHYKDICPKCRVKLYVKHTKVLLLTFVYQQSNQVIYLSLSKEVATYTSRVLAYLVNK